MEMSKDRTINSTVDSGIKQKGKGEAEQQVYVYMHV